MIYKNFKLKITRIFSKNRKSLQFVEYFFIEVHFQLKHHLQLESHSQQSIEFLEERRVISADTKGLKVWEQDSGKPVASVECQSSVNDVYHFPDTGLFLTANEQEKLMAFFIPSLNPAPKWCSFLDSLTVQFSS